MKDDENITKEDIEEAILEEETSTLFSGLRLRQELFCKAYTSHDREIFGNGVRCYLDVYGPEYLIKYKKPMAYNVAQVLASRLLSTVIIINCINSLLDAGGFNDANVDKQHLFLLNQHDDKRTKLGAIKEYNTLKRRIDNSTVVIVVDPEKKESLSKALEYLHGRKE